MDFKSQVGSLLEGAEFLRKELTGQRIELIYGMPSITTMTQHVAIPYTSYLIQNINKSHLEKFTTKQISEKTGIPEWKLRKFIASQELKADSNKSSDGNPGRSGYSISKENLIDFIKKNPFEIMNQNIYETLKQLISNTIQAIEKFIARVDLLIDLGNLELELAEIDQTEEKRAIIEKKILLQKLKIEKQFFEEQRKDFVQALQCLPSENSTEQTPETK